MVCSRCGARNCSGSCPAAPVIVPMANLTDAQRAALLQALLQPANSVPGGAPTATPALAVCLPRATPAAPAVNLCNLIAAAVAAGGDPATAVPGTTVLMGGDCKPYKIAAGSGSETAITVSTASPGVHLGVSGASAHALAVDYALSEGMEALPNGIPIVAAGFDANGAPVKGPINAAGGASFSITPSTVLCGVPDPARGNYLRQDPNNPDLLLNVPFAKYPRAPTAVFTSAGQTNGTGLQPLPAFVCLTGNDIVAAGCGPGGAPGPDHITLTRVSSGLVGAANVHSSGGITFPVPVGVNLPCNAHDLFVIAISTSVREDAQGPIDHLLSVGGAANTLARGKLTDAIVSVLGVTYEAMQSWIVRADAAGVLNFNISRILGAIDYGVMAWTVTRVRTATGQLATIVDEKLTQTGTLGPTTATPVNASQIALWLHGSVGTASVAQSGFIVNAVNGEPAQNPDSIYIGAYSSTDNAMTWSITNSGSVTLNGANPNMPVRQAMRGIGFTAQTGGMGVCPFVSLIEYSGSITNANQCGEQLQLEAAFAGGFLSYFVYPGSKYTVTPRVHGVSLPAVTLDNLAGTVPLVGSTPLATWQDVLGLLPPGVNSGPITVAIDALIEGVVPLSSNPKLCIQGGQLALRTNLA